MPFNNSNYYQDLNYQPPVFNFTRIKITYSDEKQKQDNQNKYKLAPKSGKNKSIGFGANKNIHPIIYVLSPM